MDITKILAPVQSDMREFEPAFEQVLHSDISLAEEVIRYIAGRKGKRLRPLLVFLSARLHGHTTAKTMQASVIVELLHTATLIHDDVVDESTLRRGSPTVNHLWSNKISVLIGDFLFSRTLTALVGLKDYDALAIISEAANRITEGELIQVDHDHDYEMGEDVYFDLVSKKTAALFSAACSLGAWSVADGAEARLKMRLFGEYLGIAFQIKDDLLDYIGETAKLGKPTGNDIRENKVTLPLIYALAHAEHSRRMEILDLLESGVDETGIQKVVSFVNDHGGVDYSTRIAKEYGEKACNILQTYPGSEIRTCLNELVEFAINREL